MEVCQNWGSKQQTKVMRNQNSHQVGETLFSNIQLCAIAIAQSFKGAKRPKSGKTDTDLQVH